MWCSNKQTFEDAEPGAAFLACRWHELFDEFTPDTFHPKLYSLSSLAAEAQLIGQLHENHDAWLKHLKHVQLELSEKLAGGIEASACSHRHLGMLEKISKSDSVREVVNIGRVLALEGLQPSLEEKIRVKFREFDVTNAAKKKEQADKLLTALATFSFHKGCSVDDTSNIEMILAQGGDGVRKWITDSLPAGTKEFDCIVAVNAPTREVEAAVRKVTDNPGVSRVGQNFPGLPRNDHTVFLRRRIFAIRPHDAIEVFKSEIRAALNLLALYKQALAPKIEDLGWVVNSEGATVVPGRTPSFCNLHPRKDAVGLANKAAAALGLRTEESAIRAALDLHNLALSMSDQRLRLVNLWSALECLSSLVEGDSIISRVERLVCPIIVWRKPDKVVRYLAMSIHFWLKANPEIERASLPFKLGYNESVSAEHVLALLTEPEKSPGITSLLTAVGSHPLLVYRINTAWKLFHDPKQLHGNLAKSTKRLSWHLWRIYRARNLLVHQGIESDCLPQLANHLQQYLSWTLSRLLHGLTFGPNWTARDSWNFWKSKSDHLLDTLSNEPQLLTLEDIFPEKPRNPQSRVYPPATGD